MVQKYRRYPLNLLYCVFGKCYLNGKCLKFAVKYIKMLTREGCLYSVLAIKDALEALEGRWKLLILLSLSGGKKRFGQMAKEIGMSDKSLSKELKMLEENK